MKLVADDLTLARGNRALVSGLSFAVEAGSALLVTGPNGAGKTTLIRAVAGLFKPTAGRISLEGGQPDHTLAEECHYVGHLNAIKASLTVDENVAFWSSYLGASKDGSSERVAGALSTFGLAGLRDIPAAYLSAGQKRRLGLARLLLAQRPLWLLDEPTTSLDAAAQAALVDVMRSHLAGGGMLVVATHLQLGLQGARELSLGGGI
jgi:heme exporter protein A